MSVVTLTVNGELEEPDPDELDDDESDDDDKMEDDKEDPNIIRFRPLRQSKALP
jgi:hypothetical protein